jgi:hypothetical protein
VRSDEQRIADILAATTDAAMLVEAGHSAFVADPLLIRAAKNIVSEIELPQVRSFGAQSVTYGDVG